MKRGGDLKKILIVLSIIILLSACNKINPKIEQNKDNLEVQNSTKLLLVTDEWAPYTSKNLEEYGMVSKIVALAMEEAGLEYEIQFRPWARALEMVKYGDAWGSFPWFYTDERAEEYYYSNPIMSSNIVVFYKKTNNIIENPDIEIKNLDNLKSYKIGGVFGYFYEPYLEDNKNQFRYDLSSDAESAFKLLESGKVDIIFEEEAVGWHIIANMFPEREHEFATFKNQLSEEKFYLIVTKEDRFAIKKIEAFNKGLSKIKQSGEYKKILEVYKAS